jgi:hypothetical protein
MAGGKRSSNDNTTKDRVVI